MLCRDCEKLKKFPTENVEPLYLWYQHEEFGHKPSLQDLRRSAEYGCYFCDILIARIRLARKGEPGTWEHFMSNSICDVRCMWEIPDGEWRVPETLHVAVVDKIGVGGGPLSVVWIELDPHLDHGEQHVRSFRAGVDICADVARRPEFAGQLNVRVMPLAYASLREVEKLLQSWIRLCDTHHPSCNTLQTSRERSFLLSRTIDVGPPDGSMVPHLAVHEKWTSAAAQSNLRLTPWVTLSYRWGVDDMPPTITTLNVSAAFRGQHCRRSFKIQ